MRIAVNVGCGFITGVECKNHKSISFPSIIVPTADEPNMGYGVSKYQVNIEGSSYYIGEKGLSKGGSRGWETTERRFEYVRCFIATAVHQLVDVDEPIELILGLPKHLFKAMHESVQEILQGTKIGIQINDEEKLLNIRTVVVYPETIGMYYATLYDSKGNITARSLFNKPIGIIQIGYQGVDLLYMKKDSVGLTPLTTMSPNNYGMKESYRFIQTQLKSMSHGEPDLIEIEKAVVLYNGELDFKGKTYDLLELQNQGEIELASQIANWVDDTWGNEIGDLEDIFIIGEQSTTYYLKIKEKISNLQLINHTQTPQVLGLLAAHVLVIEMYKDLVSNK
ncbi:ParM/StbA family protein [Paenibacillus agilis]|uniref:ParM/StbA family protein n=1 Tax=Paenibacillus agilis TaxID=3020863 RepID=A0A559ID89_9BACL|nr:ParM/StbA family protein [Paenibacillus agilis]TVX85631.1 ParM/StbA family protein [Paenibacillus agilis]